MSVWGVVALIGILVNDAVVMLDKYNRNLEEGMDMEQAVIGAGKSRFRAIILTTITTFVGLFSTYFRKEFSSTILNTNGNISSFWCAFRNNNTPVYTFPSLIMYFNDIRRARWWLWNGGENPPTKMEVEPFTKLQ